MHMIIIFTITGLEIKILDGPVMLGTVFERQFLIDKSKGFIKFELSNCKIQIKR